MVKEGKIHKEKDSKFIVTKSELLIDEDTQEKYITITINSKIMHYIFAGLGKYKEGFKGDNESARKERDEANIIIDEFNDVKAILNNEIIDKPIGKQEPNPKIDIEGIKNDPT